LQGPEIERLEGFQAEIERLRGLIRHHDYLYYVLDAPEISDKEYDTSFKRLEQLERDYPQFLTPDSPTQRVGGVAIEKFEQMAHATPMLSLSNIFESGELIDFDSRIRKLLGTVDSVPYVVEPKLDGVAIELVYQNGILVSGETRGDGAIGEDVTPNIRTIKAVPLSLRSNGLLSNVGLIDIRGEIFMTRADFDSLNKERDETGQPSFANPRNAAAGSIRQLDPTVTAQRRLRFLAHGVGRIEGASVKTQMELLHGLNDMGIPANLEHTQGCIGVESVMAQYRKLNQVRNQLPF